MGMLNRLTRMFSRSVPLPAKPRSRPRSIAPVASTPDTPRTASPLFKALLDDVAVSAEVMPQTVSHVDDPAMHGEPGYATVQTSGHASGHAPERSLVAVGADVKSNVKNTSVATAMTDGPSAFKAAADLGLVTHDDAAPSTTTDTDTQSRTSEMYFDAGPTQDAHAESAATVTSVTRVDTPITPDTPTALPADVPDAVIDIPDSPSENKHPVVHTVQANIDKHLEELRDVAEHASAHKDQPHQKSTHDATAYKVSGPIGFVPYSEQVEPKPAEPETIEPETVAPVTTGEDREEPVSRSRDSFGSRYPKIHNPHITFQGRSGASDLDDATDADDRESTEHDTDQPARPTRPTPGRHETPAEVSARELLSDLHSENQADTQAKHAEDASQTVELTGPTLVEQDDDAASFVGSVASLAGVTSLSDLARGHAGAPPTSTQTPAPSPAQPVIVQPSSIDSAALQALQQANADMLTQLTRVSEQLELQQERSNKLLTVVERMPAMLGAVPLLNDSQEEMARAVHKMEQTATANAAKTDVLAARKTDAMTRQTGVLREIEHTITHSASTHTHVANAMSELNGALVGVRGSNEKLQGAMEAIAKRQDKREYSLAKLVRRAQFISLFSFLVAFFSLAFAALAIALAVSSDLRQAIGL